MSSAENYNLEKQKKDIEKMMKLKKEGITDIKNVDKKTLKETFNMSDEKIKSIEKTSTPDITKKTAFQMTQNAADNSMKYLEDNVGITSIFLMMEKYKWRLIILFTIFIYIIFVNLLIVYNPGEYVSYLKSILIPFFVLLGFILFTALLFSGKLKDVKNEKLEGYDYIEKKTLELLKDTGFIFGFSIMLLTILYTSTQILYQINVNFNGLTMLALIVDIFLIIFFIGLLYALGVFKKPPKDDSTEDKSKKIKDKKVYDLFYNLVLYIPCMIIDSMDFLGEQYKSSKQKVIIVLVIEIVLIMMHFIIPELIKASLQQDGTVLLNEPEYLSNENIIAYHGDLFEPAEYTSFDDENVKFFTKLNLGFRKMVGFKEGFDELTGNQYMRDLILEIGNDNERMKKLERVRKDEEARKRLSQILPNKELVIQFLDDYDELNDYSFFDFFKELKSRTYLYYNSIFGDITLFDEATKDLSEYQNSIIDRVDLTTKPYVKDYNYALSFWFYIDSTIDNGNDAYNKDVNIFSYGGKPKVTYNGKKRELSVKMLDGNDKFKTAFKTKDLLYQKWNFIVLNYNEGVLDVFINNNLVGTKIIGAPYFNKDSVKIGEDEGINGGICNVIYYEHPLTKSKIATQYNSLRMSERPVF
jgi:hypothetical protein